MWSFLLLAAMFYPMRYKPLYRKREKWKDKVRGESKKGVEAKDEIESEGKQWREILIWKVKVNDGAGDLWYIHKKWQTCNMGKTRAILYILHTWPSCWERTHWQWVWLKISATAKNRTNISCKSLFANLGFIKLLELDRCSTYLLHLEKIGISHLEA